MSYYKIKKIYDWLYGIYDPQEVFCYLIIGEKSALLYDTAYGIKPLDKAVREVCKLPYEVVLGHGHIDHANGAYQFPEVWIHPDDHELCLRHTSKTARRLVIEDLGNKKPTDFNEEEYIKRGAGNLKMLEPGQSFDLGGINVDIVPMEGHTSGSVGVLVREHKVLLNSDAANQHTWMFLRESLPIESYINMLRRVKEMDFDTFFTGHSDFPRPKSELDKYIAVAKNIDPIISKPYPHFPELSGLFYEENGIGIVYNLSKL